MREQSFAPAYYFFGDEDFLKESVTRELIASIVDPSMRVFNCQVLRGHEVLAEALDTALNTSSMFGSRRVIVIRVVSALSREARDVLLAYLRQPSPDMVLILVAPSGERPDPAFTEKSVTMNFQPLASDRVAKWIVHYAKTSLGADITPEAAMLLHAVAGAELANLAAELDKLVSYSGRGPITETTLDVVVGRQSGESLGDLLDAVIDRDAAKAVTLVPRVLMQPKTTPVLIIMALTTQLLAVAWGVAARDKGVGQNALEREFFALLRETRVHPWRSWGDATKSWARAVPLWNSRAVDEALDLLLASDRAVKETRLSSEASLIAGLVLGLCTAGTRAVA
jgi:DNA polymerase III subunit delta